MWYTLIRLILNFFILLFYVVEYILLLPNKYVFWVLFYILCFSYALPFGLHGGWEYFFGMLITLYPFVCCVRSVPNWLGAWFYIIYIYIVLIFYIINTYLYTLSFSSIFYYFLIFYYLVFCIGWSNVILGLFILNLWYRGPQLRRFLWTIYKIIIIYYIDLYKIKKFFKKNGKKKIKQFNK